MSLDHSPTFTQGLRLLRRWAAMMLVTAGYVAPVLAGGTTDCITPFVFPGPAANIVALQYETATGRIDKLDMGSRLEDTARRLGWLIKMDAWHQPTYGSLGVVVHMNLSRQPGACDPDRVQAALLGDGPALERLRPHQAAVMLSGRIYQEREEIYLQSSIRAFRVGRDAAPVAEELTLPLPGDEALRLAAVLPDEDIVFAPRRLTTSDLERIEALYTGAGRVYAEPSLDASYREIEFRPNRPMAFSVRVVDSRWLEIDSFFTGTRGFLHVDPGVSALLHQRMPELDYLNGVLGYLRARQNATRAVEPVLEPATIHRAAAAAFQRFGANADAAPSPDAVARGEAMLGIMRATGRGAADWRAARDHFKAAIAAAPHRSAYHVLTALAETQLCCLDGSQADDADPLRRLVDALSVDPGDDVALANLDIFFAYLRRRIAAGEEFPGLDTGDLSARHALVRKTVVARGLDPASN